MTLSGEDGAGRTDAVRQVSVEERNTTRELLAWDWAQSDTGIVLHHVAEIYEFHDWAFIGVTGRASCGYRGHLRVPGLLSRLGAPRCKRCCATTGYPEGIGSPKNDNTLRPLVEAELARLAHRDDGTTHAPPPDSE